MNTYIKYAVVALVILGLIVVGAYSYLKYAPKTISTAPTSVVRSDQPYKPIISTESSTPVPNK